MDHRRVVSDTVSGSSALEQRPGFMRLLDRLEQDDVLIVTKLDRLGRNAIDVATTVAKLGGMGIRVHWLALGGVDLTSPVGKMTMGVINAVAQFEPDLLIERTQAGLARAKAEGSTLGRPATFDDAKREAVREQLEAGQRVNTGEAVWHQQANHHAGQRCRVGAITRLPGTLGSEELRPYPRYFSDIRRVR